MTNGITDVKKPMNAYFLLSVLNAPMALCPVLRPMATSSIISAKPNVTTSTI